MTLPVYKTLSEKNSIFESLQISEVTSLHDQLLRLMNAGFYFRGQANASWKLYSSAQREWITKQLGTQFSSVTDFVKQHIVFQLKQAASLYAKACKDPNDISALSVMQHYGAPTPFLDFTSKPDVAIFFATDSAQNAASNELDHFVSIYAWQPGNGPATGANNDMTNWETIVDQYDGDAACFSIATFERLTAIYIKEDSKRYMSIANIRLDLQNGLFLFIGRGQNLLEPCEVFFDGVSAFDVVTNRTTILLPKMKCFDIHKSLLPELRRYLDTKGVTKSSLGLDNDHWAGQVYKDFLMQSSNSNRVA